MRTRRRQLGEGTARPDDPAAYQTALSRAKASYPLPGQVSLTSARPSLLLSIIIGHRRALRRVQTTAVHRVVWTSWCLISTWNIVAYRRHDA